MITEEEIKEKLAQAEEINKFLKLFSSGAKSIKSISRKFNSMPEGVPIGDIKDLVRATILIDDYKNVPHLMTELKQIFENFTGDVARSSSGYCGIHGNVQFDGFRAELQISTPEVLQAK